MNLKEGILPATQFANAGYACLRGIYAQAQLSPLKSALVSVFLHTFPDVRPAFNAGFDDPEFDAAVIDKRLKSKEAFGRFYDVSQTNIAVNRLFLDGRLLEDVALLLDCPVAGLAWSGSLLRIDVPDDKRNTLGWHQDQHYLPYNKAGRGVVVSVSLSGATEAMGALHVVVDSHRMGVVDPVAREKDRFSTQQLNVGEQHIDPEKSAIIETGSGDAICLDMRTVHRSGFNSSSRVRWSCLMRFHSSLDPDFLPFRRMQNVIA